MAKEPGVTTSVTQKSVARVRSDQRFEIMSAHARATESDNADDEENEQETGCSTTCP
jgi:hypothetical protein